MNNGLPGSVASDNVYSTGVRMGGMIEGVRGSVKSERARTHSSSILHARNLRLFACERASSVNGIDGITRCPAIQASVPDPLRGTGPRTGTPCT